MPIPMTIRRAASALLLAVVAIGAAASAALADPAALFASAAPAPGASVDHAPWERLLKTYVKPAADGVNRVDYAAFKSGGHAALKSYIAALQTVDPATLDRNGQIAFLANLYNAETIDIVLDKYPVKSIKDISLGGGLVAAVTGGPWKAKVLTLRGQKLSLDDLEHAILRPVFKDPRVHYAVNCASIGCPNLQPEAFSAGRLDAQLDAAARAYVNHPRGARVTSGKLYVSSIYNWFNADFGGNDAGVIRHLQKFAAPELAAALKTVVAIAGHDYDWSLNDTSRLAPSPPR